MWIKHVMLAILAFISGVGVSAGTFAFILVIGVIPRMLRKTHLAKKIIVIENVVMLGGIAGSILAVFLQLRILGLDGNDEFSMVRVLQSGNAFQPLGLWIVIATIIGHIIVALYGLCAGIFVGCISVALAEILNTFPILFKRLCVKRGLQWVMLMMAFGKFAGALFYFLTGYKM